MLRRVRAVSVVMLIVSANCATDTHGVARRIERVCGQPLSEQDYFLDVFLDETESMDTRAGDLWKFLSALGEPSLACASSVEETYRLLYLPERGEAFAIRAERAGGEYRVTLTYESARQVPPRRAVRPLTRADWAALTSAIDDYNFWTRAVHSTAHNGLLVVHAPAWFLEGTANGWYHAVTRGSTSKERAFDAPARVLFELAQLEVPGLIKPRPY